MQPHEMLDYGKLAEELSPETRFYISVNTERLELTPGQFIEGVLLERWARENARQAIYPSPPHAPVVLHEFAQGDDGKIIRASELLQYLINLKTGALLLAKPVTDASVNRIQSFPAASPTPESAVEG